MRFGAAYHDGVRFGDAGRSFSAGSIFKALFLFGGVVSAF